MKLLGLILAAFAPVGRAGALEAACALIMRSRPTPRARSTFLGEYEILIAVIVALLVGVAAMAAAAWSGVMLDDDRAFYGKGRLALALMVVSVLIARFG